MHAKKHAACEQGRVRRKRNSLKTEAIRKSNAAGGHCTNGTGFALLAVPLSEVRTPRFVLRREPPAFTNFGKS